MQLGISCRKISLSYAKSFNRCCNITKVWAVYNTWCYPWQKFLETQWVHLKHSEKIKMIKQHWIFCKNVKLTFNSSFCKTFPNPHLSFPLLLHTLFSSINLCKQKLINFIEGTNFINLLMQIWKSANIFVFTWK